MRAAFERRGQTAHRMLNGIDGVTCIEPQGAFYAFPNLTWLLGRSLAGRSAATTTELAEVLLEEAKVAVVPGVDFGSDDHVRLSYATSAALITEGLARIIGTPGEQTGAGYKITIGRSDFTMKQMGATINARMGLNTWAAFRSLVTWRCWRPR